MKNDLVLSRKNLPATITELKRFILIGREKLVSVRAEIRAIDKIGLAKEVREQKREEASMLAGALLDAEARMGELIKEIERKPTETGSGGRFGGSKKVLPDGITHKQSSAFQALADHKDIIEQVKADAEEQDDLPTRTEVLRRIKEKEREERHAALKPSKLPEGVFDVIYADPPWEYDFSETSTREVENKYPTMTVVEIMKIPLPIAENAVLFLWATAPKIREAIAVMEAWGFGYKTNAVWDKEKIGMGYWFRGQHELLLVGSKGEMPVPDPSVRVSSVHRETRTAHSKKPSYFYEVIERYFPAGKYLEVFARNARKGWASWGNEV